MTQKMTPIQFSPLRSGCVLFASASERPPIASLRRALALADCAGVELQLVRIMSERELLHPLAADRQAGTNLERFVDAARASSRYCEEVLGSRYTEQSLALAVGTLRDVAAIHASELGAAVVVVPAGDLRGRDVTDLARSASRPVLVVRPPIRGDGSIVAATDLTCPGFPVLRSARALALLHKTRIVALHAVRDLRLAEGIAVQLEHATSALGLDESALLPAYDPVTAILEEATKRVADVIVVGTHARSPWARALRSSVAAQLVDRAERSVWVEPILG